MGTPCISCSKLQRKKKHYEKKKSKQKSVSSRAGREGAEEGGGWRGRGGGKKPHKIHLNYEVSSSLSLFSLKALILLC